ncbi:peptidoglycan-recognition protein 3-like isoform X1 [Melitaea cinxia]|uniref:peptidoglycan-recognition protein 3-like isoform X1 n=2 Tax=Melitaea cinxia TaxID=113334 RepID=UPI001E27206D|nr:peptidoglycan-recognition protein 3-like isoform X1 [Melitaea cinxia]
MQSLISPVDHESRYGSYYEEDDESEETPLLPRCPRNDERIKLLTIMAVIMMGMFLMCGLSIGIYLLITEDDSENMLPPVQVPPLFVPRAEWDAMSPNFSKPEPVFRAKSVVVDQTDTRHCSDKESCIELMTYLEDNINENKILPYNFMISSDGYIYEYLGWDSPSQLYPKLQCLLIAFIGSFTYEMPSFKQLQSAGNILTASVSNGYLNRNFTFIVKNDTLLGSGYIRNTILNQFETAIERTHLFRAKHYFFRSDKN